MTLDMVMTPTLEAQVLALTTGETPIWREYIPLVDGRRAFSVACVRVAKVHAGKLGKREQFELDGEKFVIAADAAEIEHLDRDKDDFRVVIMVQPIKKEKSK